MNVGVILTVVTAKLVNDALWPLGRGCIVQVNQGVSVHLLIEDRKISPEPGC